MGLLLSFEKFLKRTHLLWWYVEYATLKTCLLGWRSVVCVDGSKWIVDLLGLARVEVKS